MGIGVVIVFWAVVGTVFATAGMLILRSATTFLTRSVPKGRRAVILAATALPFVCFAWGAAVFVFQWDINEKYFHRDPGIGDAWKCPLPNGYALLMIDLPWYGWVYNPKTQLMPDVVGEQEDALFGVRVLQIANRYIAAGVDDHVLANFGTDKEQIDSYFLLDTSAGTRTRFATLDELRTAAAHLGIELTLEPINRVYSKYRFTWFDRLVQILFVGPPLLGVAALGVWIFLLKRRHEPFSTQPA